MSKTKDHKNLKAIHNGAVWGDVNAVMSKTKDHKNLKAIHNKHHCITCAMPDVKDQRS